MASGLFSRRRAYKRKRERLDKGNLCVYCYKGQRMKGRKLCSDCVVPMKVYFKKVYAKRQLKMYGEPQKKWK